MVMKTVACSGPRLHGGAWAGREQATEVAMQRRIVRGADWFRRAVPGGRLPGGKSLPQMAK
jgi:hypothetical protein